MPNCRRFTAETLPPKQNLAIEARPVHVPKLILIISILILAA
jgi:hypothetical protein